MVGKLEYNFLGMISVPARALKAKKIFISSLYLFMAFLIYRLFFYLASIVDAPGATKDHFSSVTFHQALPHFESLPASGIFYLGAIWAVFLIMMGIMTVAAFDFEALRGNSLLTARKALKSGLKRAKQLFLSELAIIAFIVLIILLNIMIGLLTRLPYLGEWLYSIFFFFPSFIIALITVLIIFILVLSVLIMPAAVMADRNGESFNSLLETFSIVLRQPLRWTGYTLYSIAAAKAAGFIFAYFAFRAVQFLKFSAAIGGGEKIGNLIAAGMNHLPIQSPALLFTTHLCPGIDFGFDLSSLSGGGDQSIAGYLMAASLFLIFLSIWGYIFSVIATGQAYGLAMIRKIRTGNAIADEKPLFEDNPPVNQTESKGNLSDTP